MNFAVVKIAGKQHLVTDGSLISVNASLGEPDQKITFSEVLMLGLGEELKIGTPLLSGTAVSAQIISVGRGEKIRVSKFKAKSRYRRVQGFRPQLTTLKIITVGAAKESKSAEPKIKVRKTKTTKTK